MRIFWAFENLLRVCFRIFFKAEIETQLHTFTSFTEGRAIRPAYQFFPLVVDFTFIRKQSVRKLFELFVHFVKAKLSTVRIAGKRQPCGT